MIDNHADPYSVLMLIVFQQCKMDDPFNDDSEHIVNEKKVKCYTFENKRKFEKEKECIATLVVILDIL